MIPSITTPGAIFLATQSFPSPSSCDFQSDFQKGHETTANNTTPATHTPPPQPVTLSEAFIFTHSWGGSSSSDGATERPPLCGCLVVIQHPQFKLLGAWPWCVLISLLLSERASSPSVRACRVAVSSSWWWVGGAGSGGEEWEWNRSAFSS